MASPATELSTLRPDLGQSFEEFSLEMDRRRFIGLQVLPYIEVGRKSGVFSRLRVEDLLKLEDDLRSPRTGYNRGDFNWVEEDFKTRARGYEEPVDEEEEDIYSEFFQQEQVAAEICRDIVHRNREKRVADLVFDTAVWTGSLTTAITTDWTAHDSSTPIDDVSAGILQIHNDTRVVPNALILTWEARHHLQRNTQIVDRVKYQGFQDARPGRITDDAIAQALGLERLLVAGSGINTANEAAAPSLGSIWNTDMAMIARVATTDSVREPCVGRQWHWAGSGSTQEGTMETYEEVQTRNTIVRCRLNSGEKILYPELGHLLTGVLT